MDSTEPITKVREALTKFQEGVSIMNSGGGDYYLRKLLEYSDMLFSRFCPFKRGDRVRLTKSFTTDNIGHGWYSHQHNLIEGATGTVVALDARDGKFMVEVEIDKQTYIPHYGDKTPKPLDRLYTFDFPADQLELLPTARILPW